MAGNRIFLPEVVRPQALYIAGNPGYGKSSLIQKMVLQDIHAKPKRGVCVIDPAGDLVNKLVHWIPEDRVADTIYFDTDNPVPIDFFSYRKPAERTVLFDQLLDIFHLDNAPVSRPRLLTILATLLDANQNPKIPDDHRATFFDIEHFIVDRDRRHKILSYCPQWLSEWPDATFTKLADFTSILERMRPFKVIPELKTMLSAKRPKLDIAEVMRKNQILLVNLKETETDAFIGSLIASKFQQATFARRYIPPSQRVPYYLYIDECDTVLQYAEKYFKTILLRARKYRLCLALSNPIPEDLPDGIRRKLGTMGSLMLFNLDTNNAHLFKSRIAPYDIEHLVNLPPFRAIFRTRNKVRRIKTPKFLGKSSASFADKIRENTIRNYACSAEIVRKRTLEQYSCSPPPVPEIIDHGDDEKHSKPSPTEPQPAGRPKGVPPHRSKTRRA